MSDQVAIIFLLFFFPWLMWQVMRYYFDRREGRQAKLITNRFEPDDPLYYKLLGDLLAVVLFSVGILGIVILMKRLIFD